MDKILKLDTKVLFVKGRNYKFDLIKTKFCSEKNSLKGKRKQATEQDEIFANHIFDKAQVLDDRVLKTHY